MDKEGTIQVNLQLPAAALDGLSRLAEQLRKLAAAVNGSGPPAHASEEIAESGSFDPDRFQALRWKEAENTRADVSKRIPAPETAGQEIPGSANETKQENTAFAVDGDTGETGAQTTADNVETDGKGIPSARTEADGRIPDPQIALAMPESPLPDAESVGNQAEERDFPLHAVRAEISAGAGLPPDAGLTVTTQQNPPESRWTGLAEELAAAGPAPLTAEAVSLAFQRDGRRYDNGFPLY